MAINSIRLGPLYWFPEELEELIELAPKDDLELELDPELELVEEIENEEGSFGLTLLCPAVEEELSSEDGKMTRVLSTLSSAIDVVIVRRRRRIGIRLVGATILLVVGYSLLVIEHQKILLSISLILSLS